MRLEPRTNAAGNPLDDGMVIPTHGLGRLKFSTNPLRRLTLFGDSTLQGAITAGHLGLPQQLYRDISKVFPGETIHPGIRTTWTQRPAAPDVADREWTFTGSIVGQFAVNSACPQAMTGSNAAVQIASGAANYVTWTRPGWMTGVTHLDIVYTDTTSVGGANVSYQVDAGPWVNIPLTKPAVGEVKKVTVVAADPATVTIRGADATGATGAQLREIIGVVPYIGSTGIVVDNMAKSGATLASTFGEAATPRAHNFMSYWSLYQPEAVVYCITNNSDMAPTELGRSAWVETGLTYIESLTGGDIILAGQIPQNPTGRPYVTQWRNAYRAMAVARGWSYFNFGTRWGDYDAAQAAGLMTDGVHPSTTGAALMTRSLLRHLDTGW